MGGLSTAYYLQQRQARAAAIEQTVSRAVTLRDQAAAHPEDVARWQVALAALEQAEAGAGGAEPARDRLLALRTEVQAGLDGAQRDRALLDRLVDIRSAKADDPAGSATDAAYADAFGEAGLALAAWPPAEVGRRSRPVRRPWRWAWRRRWTTGPQCGGASGRTRPGPKRLSQSRPDHRPRSLAERPPRPLDQPDKQTRLAAVSVLTKTAQFDELGSVSLDLLGTALHHGGDAAAAEAVLRAAQRRHPGDVWVNYDLAGVLEKLARRDDAIRYYTAARSIRPETAHALEDKGELDEERGGPAH